MQHLSSILSNRPADATSTMYIRQWTFFVLVLLVGFDAVAETIKTSDNFNTNLTQTEVKTAEAWNLTQAEFSQLKQLKTQYQGLLSANLSPLEWLGIFATSDAQRDHYAKKFAHQQLETTTAILKFEASYTNAIKALTAKSMDSAPHGGRVLILAALQCSDKRCTNRIIEGLNHVNQGGTLEVYVQNPFKSTDIRTWAVTNQVPFEYLRDGNINIRQAKGRMLDVAPGIYRVNSASQQQ